MKCSSTVMFSKDNITLARLTVFILNNNSDFVTDW
jgi:hypothetical protein